jgi:putative two-component system response regulator
VAREVNKSAGAHFDPGLIEAFNAVLPEIIKIMEQYADRHGAMNDLDFIKSAG